MRTPLICSTALHDIVFTLLPTHLISSCVLIAAEARRGTTAASSTIVTVHGLYELYRYLSSPLSCVVLSGMLMMGIHMCLMAMYMLHHLDYRLMNGMEWIRLYWRIIIIASSNSVQYTILYYTLIRSHPISSWIWPLLFSSLCPPSATGCNVAILYSCHMTRYRTIIHCL